MKRLVLAVALTVPVSVMAQEPPPHAVCPVPGESCKILLLSPQEEKMLMTQNGILDTAAQGRALDLGQISVYLKTRIASAPSGVVKPVLPTATSLPPNEKPIPQMDREGNLKPPVDSTPK